MRPARKGFVTAQGGYCASIQLLKFAMKLAGKGGKGGGGICAGVELISE